MVVGRNAFITHGSTQNNALLHELLPENHLWIHPESAAAAGVADGDRVEVASAAGRGRLRVKTTRGIREDTVFMETGFGVMSKGLRNIFGTGASISEILEDHNDEISGNMAMHETFVSIRKI